MKFSVLVFFPIKKTIVALKVDTPRHGHFMELGKNMEQLIKTQMARFFRKRRGFGRRLRRSSRKSLLLRKKMMLRRRIKRFVNRMGYPSYVKLIGMTESKKLLLRRTLTLNAPVGTSGEDDNVGDKPASTVFQVVLNPLECPNITKVFTNVSFLGPEESEENYNRVFKYDYLRIKSVFISIKPAQNMSANSGAANGAGLYTSTGDSPISNVYAYFTYRYPMLGVNDGNDQIKQMYGTNPIFDRIVAEGRMKNTYTWPSNKAMTISLNKLMYRVNTDPYRLFPNAPFDIQYLTTLNLEKDGIYDPFQFYNTNIFHNAERDDTDDNDDEMKSTQHEVKIGDDGDVMIPDLKSAQTNLFFGRLVIVAPKHVRFTVEICYDCVLLR